MPKSNANFFTDNLDGEDSDVEKSIDSEDGGIFEKIIAKIIGKNGKLIERRIIENNENILHMNTANLVFTRKKRYNWK